MLDFDRNLSDWPRRLRTKSLIRLAKQNGLTEMVHIHALSTYGCEIWNLPTHQICEIEDIVVSFSARLAIVRAARRTVN